MGLFREEIGSVLENNYEYNDYTEIANDNLQGDDVLSYIINKNSDAIKTRLRKNGIAVNEIETKQELYNTCLKLCKADKSIFIEIMKLHPEYEPIKQIVLKENKKKKELKPKTENYTNSAGTQTNTANLEIERSRQTNNLMIFGIIALSLILIFKNK